MSNEKETTGFEIPAGAVRVGSNSFHIVPPGLILPRETPQQASERLLSEAFGSTLSPHEPDKGEVVSAEVLRDPNIVFINMLRGGIAKPTWAQIKSLYPEQFGGPAE